MLPGEEAVVALLALMLLQHARRDARTDGDGRLVPLPEQDRARWRHDEIEQGLSLVRRLGPPTSEYHLQALIAAEHATGTPDWPRIATLYADLDDRTGSPVVRLNRAVAVAEAGSPEAAWHLLEGLEQRMPASHLLPAVRGELLTRLGRRAEASAAFTEALRLVRTDAERTHLQKRRDGRD
jgi:RNA polymerase sigma-70 factor (ECF subfamily)